MKELDIDELILKRNELISTARMYQDMINKYTNSNDTIKIITNET